MNVRLTGYLVVTPCNPLSKEVPGPRLKYSTTTSSADGGTDAKHRFAVVFMVISLCSDVGQSETGSLILQVGCPAVSESRRTTRRGQES